MYLSCKENLHVRRKIKEKCEVCDGSKVSYLCAITIYISLTKDSNSPYMSWIKGTHFAKY